MNKFLNMYGSVLTAKTSNKLSLFKAKFSPGAIAEQFSVNVTVKPTESGTLEIFQLFYCVGTNHSKE